MKIKIGLNIDNYQMFTAHPYPLRIEHISDISDWEFPEVLKY
jgi:hypothetical protein